MNRPVNIDEFLAIEEEARRLAKLRAPAREVRRFHAAVRRFASAWTVGPRRRLSVETGKQGAFLNLEIEDRYDWVPVMSLRAAHPRGEFCLVGPFPGRKEVRLSTKMRKALDALFKTWKTLPGAEPAGDGAVQVDLPRLADAGFDRFLHTAIESTAEL